MWNGFGILPGSFLLMLKILFASPFELHSTEKTGVTLISRDNGMTWQEGARFFRSTDIAPWEVRSVELPSGRILLVFWAFDLKINSISAIMLCIPMTAV